MAKIVIGKVAEAVTDSVLRQLLPQFDRHLESIKSEIRLARDEIRAVDAKVDGLREDMLDRFERQLATINEVSHRITRVEGKVEGYMEAFRTFLPPVKSAQKRKAG